ncbi:MAG: translation elongation factor Ts [Spirochaetaceae bacterium]|jgi:elongation factor Ts|nr:translation elongation factor Ts [Spirochaetaceae bacterium]
MAISAADVKKLRDATGAGPLECKKALEDTGGDFGRAEKLLKEKGLAAVEKRSGRATNEGKIFVRVDPESGLGGAAVLVELASETDFVARNPEFLELGARLAALILEKGHTEPVEELSSQVTELATKIRENMSLKRLKVIKAAANEYLSSYIHGDGAIGVVVKLAAGDAGAFAHEEVRALAFNLALHIAAFNPMALDRDGIGKEYIAEQEGIFLKQMEGDEKMLAMREAKPEQFEKILQGKVNKHLQEICLLQQHYVKDEKLTVEKVLADTGRKAGSELRIADYAYFKVGE